MRKTVKIYWITAGLLILLGSMILLGVFMTMNWDFSKLSTEKYETNRYEVAEPYRDIRITTNRVDITFTRANDGKTSVTAYENSRVKHGVSVKDGVLTIETNDERKWYHHIGITFTQPKLTVALPDEEYGALMMENTTGDIDIPNGFTFTEATLESTTGDIAFAASVGGKMAITTTTGDIALCGFSAGELSLSLTTGDLSLTDVTCRGDMTVDVSTGDVIFKKGLCQNLIASGASGDFVMKNVIASGKFEITRTTGDVTFDGCDASEIYISLTTGDVSGSLLSEKVFIPHVTTGDVELPKTTSGGICEITTTTGDITITIKEGAAS